jgi:predicted metalloprotease with PDZ domain
VAVHNFDAAPAVASVTADGEAERAGLTVGDDILEANGYAAGSDFEQRLAELRPGDTLHLQVRNSGGERELHWKLAHREEVAFELKDVDNITAQQKTRRAAWLKGESGVSEESRP